MFFRFKRPTFPCCSKTIMCIKYLVSFPRSFLSSLSRVQNCNCTYGSGKLERVKLSVTLKKRRRQLYFKEANKNFPWTAVHWERVIEKHHFFWGTQLEQHVEETVKVCWTVFPHPLLRHRFTLSGHCAAKVEGWLEQASAILAVTITGVSIDCINLEFGIPGCSRQQLITAVLNKLLQNMIKNG